MDKLNTLQLICVWALPVLFAVTMHEAAHGWVAYKLGDDTAYQAGRISANPLKHIDLIGTVIVPILLLLTTHFLFGWAKPVPVNTTKLRHPERDTALVAAAGPLSNFLMACIWVIFQKLAIFMLAKGLSMGVPLFLMSEAGIMINLFLMVLNLLPIPPLDGSGVVNSMLPVAARTYYNHIAPFGFIILIILLMTGILSKILFPVVEALHHFLKWF